MAKTMTASMTDGQINTATKQFRDALRKHRTKISKTSAQSVNGVKNLGMQLFIVYRELAEEFEKSSNRVSRFVVVDTAYSPEEVIAFTGMKQSIPDNVLEFMPRGETGKKEVIFLKLDLSKRGGCISDHDLDKLVDGLGYKMASPYQVAQVNIDDPTFVNQYRNCTHWLDAEGGWCYITFSRDEDGESYVHACRNGCLWSSDLWFAVVCK